MHTKLYFGRGAKGDAMWHVITRRWKWLYKYITEICGVGIMLQVWKYQAHNSCPRCRMEQENAEHMIRCKALDAMLIWNEAIDNLEA